MIIAIDGPAAAGKGTLSRRIAEAYGFHHLDTGLTYRATAKALLDAIKGYLFHDDSQVARLLVERREGERERITIRSFPRRDAGQPAG